MFSHGFVTEGERFRQVPSFIGCEKFVLFLGDAVPSLCSKNPLRGGCKILSAGLPCAQGAISTSLREKEGKRKEGESPKDPFAFESLK